MMMMMINHAHSEEEKAEYVCVCVCGCNEELRAQELELNSPIGFDLMKQKIVSALLQTLALLCKASVLYMRERDTQTPERRAAEFVCMYVCVCVCDITL